MANKPKFDAIPPGPVTEPAPASRQEAIDWVEAEIELARTAFTQSGEANAQGRLGRMQRHLARLSDPATGEAYAATVHEERERCSASSPR